MTNEPIDPSVALAAEYSAKADAYLQHWSPVIAPMATPLLNRLPLDVARWILDVGTGTGAFLESLQAAAPAARILAVDRALGMLRLARRETPYPLATMDAQRLAIRSGAIDAATLVFMLFHVPDPVMALTEVRRVLRPSGLVGVVTWGRDEGLPGLSIWKEELDAAGAVPDSRDPIVMQQERMNTPEKLATLLLTAGFTEIRSWTQMFEYQWTIDRVVEVQLGCGIAARRVGSLSKAAALKCETRVRSRMAILPPNALVYCPEILFVTASGSTRSG